MKNVLVAGLPPDVPGCLARRLHGAAVEEQPSPAAAADALRARTWALAILDAAWLEPDVRQALDAARAAGRAPVLLLAAPTDRRGADAPAPDVAGAARVFVHPLDREALVREAAERLAASEAPDGPPPAAPAGLPAAVAGVWARYRDSVLARVDVLESAATRLLDGRLDRDARREAERDAHKLAGSAGTFGFAEGSRLARQAEALLAGPTPPGREEALRLADLAASIRRELDASPAASASAGGAPGSASTASGGAAPGSASTEASASSPSAPFPTARHGQDEDVPLLLIVEPDREMAERLATEASARALRPLLVHDARAAWAQVARTDLAGAVIDCSLGDTAPGLEMLRALTERERAVPAVVLTSSDAFTDRVEVARMGGRAFLRKPLSPGRIIDAVEPLVRRRPERDNVVLAVDDDPPILQAVQSVLGGAGVRVETLNDPLRFWEVLESVAPDAVLLDVQMPGVNGLELCRVLRNDPRWRSVPVVFLTAQTDPGSVQQVFACGADDFVSKPFVGPELSARIANRLERVRLQREQAETDPLTGVPNRRGSEEVLERFLRLAKGQGEPFALALVDLDAFKDVNDRWGHAAGDDVLVRVARLLQKRFRAADVVARWGGEEFVVGMYGMDRADGVQRVAEALEALRDERFTPPGGGDAFGVTFSAGVAEFGADGRDLTSLYRAADTAMYAAKDAGRDRVLPAGWSAESGGARTVDVLVVQQDPAGARLLQQALETRGLRHQWVESGERAAALLAGAQPGLAARVVLLDADLPGVDGLGVLRVLAREGVVQRTRVILLAERTQEPEVLRALEMGAFDHVVKPFSVPVLLQRIRRALRA